MRFRCTIILYCFFSCFALLSAQTTFTNWQQSPSPFDSLSVNINFVGIHQDHLILPCFISEATDEQQTYVFAKDEAGHFTKSKGVFDFPITTNVGWSIASEEGLYCVSSLFKDVANHVFLLKWNVNTQSLETTKLPALSSSLIVINLAKIENTLYVFGMDIEAKSMHCFALDCIDAENNEWKAIAEFPGPVRLEPTFFAQSDGLENCLYVFGGYHGKVNGPRKDAWKYIPSKNTWTSLSDYEPSFQLNKTNGFSMGAAHSFFLGQSNEGTNLFAFHSITNAWHNVEALPFEVDEKGQLLLDSEQQIYYIDKQANIWSTKFKKKSKQHFGWLNYLVLVLYFGVLIYMGWYFSKRQQSTDDYFKGGGRVPWWAAGLSIFGTVLSAISFMAIPAKTFATDWAYFMNNLGPVFVAPIIALFFVPFYHRLNLTTAYEYLEQRFNLAARLLGSLSFMLFQIGRIGIVLYLPAIALNIVTDLDIFLCISIMGVVSIVYSMMGGIEGVIWTDVLQVIVLMGGALLSLIVILWQSEDFYNIALAENKFNVLDFSFDWTAPTFWVVFFGGIFHNLVFYATDQTVVQRYMTASNLKDAQKSVWINALLIIPGTLLFFFIGTALFVFYKNSPTALQPALASTDAIFPWYIISQLPQGISGLLIAGIFAASMSSLSSSMNSLATAYTTDFHQRFQWKGNLLTIARRATLVSGIIGTLFALLMASSDIKSVWDEFLKIVGLITGGLGGLFVLGMISKKANGKGALIGLLASAIIQYLVSVSQPVHLLLFTATGFLSCIILGYLASLIFSSNHK